MTLVANMNYSVPDELHRQAKSAAALKGVSLKQYVLDALAAAVEKDSKKGRRA